MKNRTLKSLIPFSLCRKKDSILLVINPACIKRVFKPLDIPIKTSDPYLLMFVAVMSKIVTYCKIKIVSIFKRKKKKLLITTSLILIAKDGFEPPTPRV